MDDDAFEAHLALHGLVRYTDSRNLTDVSAGLTRVYVGDEYLLDIFRTPGFVRIDQYGTSNLLRAAARAVPGFEEFGCYGVIHLYTRKR